MKVSHIDAECVLYVSADCSSAVAQLCHCIMKRSPFIRDFQTGLMRDLRDINPCNIRIPAALVLTCGDLW